MDKDQTTTPGTSCPTLYDEWACSLTSLADHNSEDAGDGAGIDISIDSQSVNSRVGRHLTDYQPTVDQASTVYRSEYQSSTDQEVE